MAADPPIEQVLAELAISADAARKAYDLSTELSHLAMTHTGAARLALEGGDHETARQLLAASNAYQDAARRVIALGGTL